jgi:hypothetical protein
VRGGTIKNYAITNHSNGYSITGMTGILPSTMYASLSQLVAAIPSPYKPYTGGTPAETPSATRASRRLHSGEEKKRKAKARMGVDGNASVERKERSSSRSGGSSGSSGSDSVRSQQLDVDDDESVGSITTTTSDSKSVAAETIGDEFSSDDEAGGDAYDDAINDGEQQLQQLGVIREAMARNLDDHLQRGQRLDSLQHQSLAVTTNAKAFKHSASAERSGGGILSSIKNMIWG